MGGADVNGFSKGGVDLGGGGPAKFGDDFKCPFALRPEFDLAAAFAMGTSGFGAVRLHRQISKRI